MSNKKIILVTGAAGFIGFHLSELLLKNKFDVIGLDAVTEYYDKNLKLDRLKILKTYKNFIDIRENLKNFDSLKLIFEKYKPNYVIHLAAQAGVRYSIENPRSYLDSNIIGTFNILELIKINKIEHILIASTSSVYGSNTEMPFLENHKTDTQISFYAATKKLVKSFLTHILIYIIYQLLILDFLLFTVPGEDQIWHYLNLLKLSKRRNL